MAGSARGMTCVPPLSPPMSDQRRWSHIAVNGRSVGRRDGRPRRYCRCPRTGRSSGRSIYIGRSICATLHRPLDLHRQKISIDWHIGPSVLLAVRFRRGRRRIGIRTLGISKFIPHFTTRNEKRRMALRTKRAQVLGTSWKGQEPTTRSTSVTTKVHSFSDRHRPKRNHAGKPRIETMCSEPYLCERTKTRGPHVQYGTTLGQRYFYAKKLKMRDDQDYHRSRSMNGESNDLGHHTLPVSSISHLHHMEILSKLP